MVWTGALRIKARDIVMAGLNARGLQSKLLITPLSSEAIIGASLSEPHLFRTMISLSLLRAKRAFWSVQCTDFLYQAVRRAVNILNVSTCI